MSYYYQQSYQDLPIRYLHRLDRDTTGLVMFCKCALLQPYFDALIASKEIKKTYLAIIQGHLPKREITIDLERDLNNILLQYESAKETPDSKIE